jgi:hypothetical protein
MDRKWKEPSMISVKTMSYTLVDWLENQSGYLGLIYVYG